jgi:hypothetical protein
MRSNWRLLAAIALLVGLGSLWALSSIAVTALARGL